MVAGRDQRFVRAEGIGTGDLKEGDGGVAKRRPPGCGIGAAHRPAATEAQAGDAPTVQLGIVSTNDWRCESFA